MPRHDVEAYVPRFHSFRKLVHSPAVLVPVATELGCMSSTCPPPVPSIPLETDSVAPSPLAIIMAALRGYPAHPLHTTQVNLVPRAMVIMPRTPGSVRVQSPVVMIAIVDTARRAGVVSWVFVSTFRRRRRWWWSWPWATFVQALCPVRSPSPPSASPSPSPSPSSASRIRIQLVIRIQLNKRCYVWQSRC
jgi:hypothetical protein